jgi:hypothetical protein
MSAIQKIFKRYAPEYLKRYGQTMPAVHKKVIYAIENCRSGCFGALHYRCSSCKQNQELPRSCGNRNCPTCQNEKASLWLDKMKKKLLPCSYFMITFTVPQELRSFIKSNQRIAYAAMFDSAAQALKKLARDPRFVGADQIGLFGVLHTWGRTLSYHPHIHFIVPAGGLSSDRKQWLASKPDFFVRVEPLSVIYKAKFRDEMKKAGLFQKIDPVVWSKPWVVNSQAVGDGRTSLKYLAPYVFRVAISNSRIVGFEGGEVTFKYRKSGSNRWRLMTVSAMEFIRRFLQHALPVGFMKIRHYGFLSGSSKTPWSKIRALICILYEVTSRMVTEKKEKPSVNRGPKCTLCCNGLFLVKFSLCRIRAG